MGSDGSMPNGWRVWEVVFVEMPTVLAMEGGSVPNIAAGPLSVIAKDRDGAVASAMQKSGVTVDSARLEVLCRPFGG